jgi:hypothetical protein
VNRLSYSVYQQLGLGELKPTILILQLTYQSIKKPIGVLIIVLNTEPVPNPEKLLPVILGSHFLATTNSCINYHTGVMEISFGNMKVMLNIFNAFQYEPDQNECFFVDNIEEYVEDSLHCLLTRDSLEKSLTHFGSEDIHIDQYIDEVNALLDTASSADFHPWRIPKEPLPLTSSTPHVPSLQALLEYAFLGSNDTLPVINASDLQKDQEDSLSAVLKEHKEAI